MIFGRKPELNDVREQVARANESTARAQAALDGVESRRGWVESIINFTSERREQNGFGEDFQITFEPRKRSA